jgi:hypothetical protein
MLEVDFFGEKENPNLYPDGSLVIFDNFKPNHSFQQTQSTWNQHSQDFLHWNNIWYIFVTATNTTATMINKMKMK